MCPDLNWKIKMGLIDFVDFERDWPSLGMRTALLELYEEESAKKYFSFNWVAKRMESEGEKLDLKFKDNHWPPEHPNIKKFAEFLTRNRENNKPNFEGMFDATFAFLFMTSLGGVRGVYLKFNNVAFLKGQKRGVDSTLIEHKSRLKLCRQTRFKKPLSQSGRLKAYYKNATGTDFKVPQKLLDNIRAAILRKKFHEVDHPLKEQRLENEEMPELIKNLEGDLLDHLSIYVMEIGLQVLQKFFLLPDSCLTIENLDQHLQMLCLYAKMGMSLYDPEENDLIYLTRSSRPEGEVMKALYLLHSESWKSLSWELKKNWGFT
jgi:hypothetical protein